MTTSIETQAEIGFNTLKQKTNKIVLERGQAKVFDFAGAAVSVEEYGDDRTSRVGIGHISLISAADRAPTIEGNVLNEITSYEGRSIRVDAVLEEGGMAIVNVPLRGQRDKLESFMVTNIN